ncbi:alpha/beta fold hydrolase [Kineococcus rhizosphaerae]|uniref:Pimeloyl-ACP methyl ester carboxylesterase n=1 Tax=Kineococcus rhizosphaerae TaxID=559628 RepID=A0A2T0RB27_9ACTN|nr:alpha/beta fold hydrolase [Kineococcus rhizosphaerae]PRY18341.1 pimeloyl-ACP methyl ester carboxylesterase [Kineococcus rhizosphaerae]
MTVLLVPGGPLLDPSYFPLDGALVADLRRAPARRCDQLVDALEEVRAVHGPPVVDLVAHSAGVNVVQRYLERFAHRVHRLVLVTPSVFAVGIDVPAVSRLRTAGLSRAEPWFGDAWAALQRLTSGRAEPGDAEAIGPFTGRRPGEDPDPALAAEFAADGAFDPAATRAALARFPGRTLVVAGELDVASPPDVARQVADLFPHGRLVQVPGARHFPWRDDPRSFRTLLEEFLAPEPEVALPGGRNLGAVRVGRTVRKAAGAQTPTAQALLQHLRDHGFDRVPRPLGLDEAGREVWEHLPGSTIGGADPWPDWVFDDALLADVGRWLRAFHDGSREFWEQDGQVLGHQDLAPYNAVVDRARRELVGFVDWDLLAPSPPLRDLAFVALRWVPLMGPDGRDRAEHRRRLGILLAAYRWTGAQDEVVAAVRVRAQEHADGLRRAAADGWGPAVDLVAEGVAEEFDRAAAGLGDLL